MTQAGRAEVFKWRKVGLAMRVTLALKKGHPARGWGEGHAKGSPSEGLGGGGEGSLFLPIQLSVFLMLTVRHVL